ncbi:MAG: sugar ABC transporter ATP-binding protein [Acidobacteriota bacterium]|nr:MAG: sugar ABC transporter ATP-binding protein [Acidobacteriota bacterium]
MYQDFDQKHIPSELIRIEGVSKSFSGVQALREVSFSIAPGQVHGLVGENGSGKSTLIKILAGVLSPDRGALFFDGQPFRSVSPKRAIRKGIQVIYQDFSLFPNLSVAENIALVSEVARGAWRVDRRRVRELATRGVRLLGVELDLDALVENLPIFQWQLVAIARALVQQARLIIMDEPTTALTRIEVDSLLKVIRSLRDSDIAVLFVSHKLNEVCNVADRLSVLRNGSVVANLDSKPFDPLGVAELMTGRPPGGRTVRDRPDDRRVLLSVSNLARQGAYSDVSFDLQEGEVLGITGLLGSGQTELAMGLSGLLPAETGRIELDGKDAVIDGIQSALDLGIAYVPEDRLREGLFPKHSVLENLLAASVERSCGFLSFIDFQKFKGIATAWVERLSIKTSSLDLPVETLSGGNQQRVVLAKWLSTEPRVLVLNNPTAGVDVGSKTEIHGILQQLAEQGCGIIIVSDDLPELLENCDSIRVMSKSRLSERLTAEATGEDQLYRMLIGEVH